MNIRRLLFVSILSLCVLAVFSSSVSARVPDPQPRAIMQLKDKVEQKAQRPTAETVALLKKKANREIDRRVEALRQLIERIKSAKKLSDSQKVSLATQIETEVNHLLALKAEIGASTDLEVLRTHVKSIVDSYRIYALFMPKINIIIAADRIMETADSLDALATRVAPQLQSLSSLEDLKERTANARKQAQEVIDLVMPLSPDGYPENKKQLTEAREKLHLAQTDLAFARSSLARMLGDIKKVNPKLSSTPPQSY